MFRGDQSTLQGQLRPVGFKAQLRPRFLGYLPLALVVPAPAYAVSLEGTLQNLVNALLGRILPILALGYLGKNVFAHVQGDPNAKNDSIRIVIAIACLLGINGVWQFIQQQVR